MIRKLFVIIVLIFVSLSCYVPNQIPVVLTLTSTVTYTPFQALTNTPFSTPTPFLTSTPFPTLVPNIGEYQGIGARQIDCGNIFLPIGTVVAECYNIGGIGGARIYFDNSNLVIMAIVYKIGQGYDAGIFATKIALQYDWNVNDLIGLISMMKETGILYTNGSISGICEVSEDNLMVYMLISPDASFLLNGININ